MISSVSHLVIRQSAQVNATSRVQDLLKSIAYTALGMLAVQFDATFAVTRITAGPEPKLY